MQKKVMKVGNSLGMTIPSNFAKTIGVVKGSQVKVEIIPEKCQLVYTFQGSHQLSLGAIFKE